MDDFFEGLNSLPGFNLIFGKSPAYTSGSPSLRHLDITYMQDRIVAIGKPWNGRTEKQAKRNNISELGHVLEERHHSRYLVLNLASGKCSFDYFKLAYQVLECDLERNPTLQLLFQLCHAARKWLDLHEENVLAVFCGNGVSATRLFVSAYLSFSGCFKSTYESLEYFYDRRLRVTRDAKSLFKRAQPSLRHTLDNFQSILEAGRVPQSKALELYMILFERIPPISDEGLIQPQIFNIFQEDEQDGTKQVQPVVTIYHCTSKGRFPMYTSNSDPDSILSWNPDEGKLVLKCDCRLMGDMVIECTFPGNVSKKLFKYSFHTGFLEEKHAVYSIHTGHIDTNYRSSFEENFKMDLVLQPLPNSKSKPSRDDYKFLTKLNTGCAVEILTKLHFVQADTLLQEKLCARGHDSLTAEFALQQTNNDLHESILLLEMPASRTVRGHPMKSGSPRTPEHVGHLRQRSKKHAARRLFQSPLRANISAEILRSNPETPLDPKRLRTEGTSKVLSSPGTKQTGSELSPFLRREFGDDLASPAKLASSPQVSSLVYIEDEQMTNELVAMLETLSTEPKLNGSTKKDVIIKTPVSRDVFVQNQDKECPLLHEEDNLPCRNPMNQGVSMDSGSLDKRISLNLVENTSTTSSKEQESGAEYDRFRKMLKMGVPPGAVRTKVASCGLDPRVLGLEDEDVQPTKPVVAPEKYNKFSKMLKMGVPPEAVRTKLIAEGLDPSTIGLGQPSSSTTSAQKAQSIRRKRFHWQVIPEEKLKQNSIWNTSTASPTKTSCEKDDLEEIESLFVENQKLPSSKASTRKPSSSKTLPPKPLILERNRIQNIGIGLAKLKLNGKQVAEALNTFDNNVLCLEKLQIVVSSRMIPTQEEMKKVLQFRGDCSKLSSSEQFVVALSQSCKYGEAQVEAMIFRAELGERVNVLLEKFGRIQRACAEIQESKLLRKLFQVVLLIGNRINSAGHESVQGFTVGSLLKLAHTKSFNRTTTILDYISTFASRKIPQVIKVRDELGLLKEVKRFQIGTLKAEESSLHMGLQRTLRTLKGIDAIPREMQGFVRQAQETMRIVEKEISKTESAYLSLLEYFCEDPELAMHDFFTTLDTFLDGFSRSVYAYEEKKKREERARAAQKQKSKLERTKSCVTFNAGNENKSPNVVQGTSDSPLKKKYKTPLRKAKSCFVEGRVVERKAMVNQTTPRNTTGKETMSKTPNLKRFLEEN